MAALDRALQAGAAAAADRRSGQKGLFDEVEESPDADDNLLPDIPEWDEREKLAREKEVLGFYLSSHPLTEHLKMLSTYCSHTTAQAAEQGHRAEVTLGGIISAIKYSNTKNPKPGNPSRFAMFDLEDAQGLIRTICWPDLFVHYENLIQPDAIVVIRGTVDKRPGSEEANLIVNEIIPLHELSSRLTRGMTVRVDEAAHGPEKLRHLYEILRGYPGKAELQLQLCLADGCKVSCTCDRLALNITPELRTRVDALLGPGHVRLITSSARSGNGRR